MRFSSLGRFLLVAIASLLCLMPLWYYLAPQIAKPVFFLAGEAAGAAFRWVQGYDVKETVGTLNTQLKMVSVQNGQLLLGKLAPLVDYRMLGYQKNRGLRIDHILVSQPLLPRVRSSTIDRAPRKWEKPSDHAPVVLELGPAT